MYGELILEDELTDAERFEVTLTDARRMMQQLADTAEAAGKRGQAVQALAALATLHEAVEIATYAFNKDD